MAKPTIPLQELKEHLGVSHDLDDDLITRLGSAAVDVCLAEIGEAQQPGCDEPETWATLFETVPDWFRTAVGFMTTHYYENRSAVVVGSGLTAMELPNSSRRILDLHRETRFM